MRDKFPAELGQGDLKTIALRFYDEMQQETQKQILGLWQWEPLKRKGGYGLDYHEPLAANGIAASMMPRSRDSSSTSYSSRT